MNEKIFHIGIDLHGTLITNDEFLSKGSESELVEVLESKPENAKLYICTGNDLSFIKRKIPGILPYFDGAVLETGCVISEDLDTEEIIVPETIVKQIKELELTLIDCDYPEVYKFARRLSSISMFTRHGMSLEDFFGKISEELKYIDYARVTRSSVAVDIIPSKHDKYNGLEFFARSNGIIVAIADSLNDIEWLKKADYSFMPSNADPAAVEQLCPMRRRKVLGDDFDIKSFYISDRKETFGVTDILKFIFKNA